VANETEEKTVAQAAAPEAAAPRSEEARPSRGQGRRERPPRREEREEVQDEFEERVIVVNRSSKTVKGGRNFSFGALVVVGDKKGRVGMGFGKANEATDAIRKGGEQARRYVMNVPMFGATVSHQVEARFCAAKVLIKPASSGTGVVAGGGMRAVLELAGIQDVLAKSLGSNNQVNVVKATFEALKKLRSKADVLAKRDVNAL